MRIGVFGGTFDPPHTGHRILSELARDQARLDKVLWVPAGEPPHKLDRRMLPVKHRVEMVNRSIQDNDGFALSLVDVNREGPHYTVDMLRLLANEYRGSELHLVIGGDSLRDFASWREPAELIRCAQLVVMSRPNVDYGIEQLENQLPGISDRTLFLDAPLIEISGRDIRQRAKDGRSIRYLVADSVQDYILQNNLYQDYED